MDIYFNEKINEYTKILANDLSDYVQRIILLVNDIVKMVKADKSSELKKIKKEIKSKEVLLAEEETKNTEKKKILEKKLRLLKGLLSFCVEYADKDKCE
jgi:hypothetical protein